ncbi:MAG TPA: ATP-dependent zinc metalloprotease FtsH [Vicinamibacterales bacterium]|nr:ATP-dependent zinc metalloprotease FtsH [Vicinamibacterales bacterium]
MRPSRKLLLIAGAALVVALIVFMGMRVRAPETRGLAFTELLTAIEAGQVSELIVRPDALHVTFKDGTVARSVAPPGYIAANPTFMPDLARRRVIVRVEAVAPSSGYQVGALLLALGFLGLLGFMVYRVTAGRIPSMETQTRMASRDLPVVTFADVAGVDEAKDEVREIVDFLREPQKFARVGGRIPKGVLLVGPPGTGKTLLARSIAGEAGVPFLCASGSDFVEMYAGVGASRVRKLFRDARKHKACIIFIDELDAVGRNRGSHSLSHEEREQTLNQLLVEMDGFAPNEGIVVIAATNRQDILDPALLRPGRFDRQVVVGNPDLKGREAILRVHAQKVSLAPDVDLRAIARGTPGFSGADLANVINEAALLAARSGRQRITSADLEEARDKVLMGVERRSLVMTEDERVNCAYHEAGHAVVAAMLPNADPLHKVTIIPRGRALGVTMQLPENDRHTHTRDYLEAQIAILMGGRVAEELFMRHMTSGAGSDIERATEIARRMVCEFGMSALGPIAYRRPGADEQGSGFSEATARRVDDEIRELVMRGYETARQILERHRDKVRALAGGLLANESLDADEIRAVLGGATPWVPPAPAESVGQQASV